MKLTIRATRKNVRGPLADFHVTATIERDGVPEPDQSGEIKDFARALGAEGLFGQILSDVIRAKASIDENGDIIPMPEMTAERHRENAAYLRCRADAEELRARVLEGTAEEVVLSLTPQQGSVEDQKQ